MSNARPGGASASSGRASELASLPRAVLDSILDWFYPRHCYHCGQPLEGSRARILCPRCVEDLTASRIVAPVCAVCGLGLSGAPAADAVCLACQAEQRHFDVARAFVAYAGPATSIICTFKFDGQFFLGPRFLEAMLDRGWMPEGIGAADLVVPVPLHPQRRRERGYDQALLLAKVLAKRLGCKLMPRALVRTRYTSQQSLLPVAQRWDNVRGAFAVPHPARVVGRRVLLVDDVMTTGMTADECAKALKKAGALRVEVLVLARPSP